MMDRVYTVSEIIRILDESEVRTDNSVPRVTV